MINVNYTGRLTNGTVFDQGTFPQPYKLYDLIRGWTSTLPLIKQGGRMRLFIPPSLGYGARAIGSIPANSILVFDVELTFVN
jgi:FKBP-type peptidyl-prolyl cis-trans isomerase FkpA